MLPFPHFVWKYTEFFITSVITFTTTTITTSGVAWKIGPTKTRNKDKSLSNLFLENLSVFTGFNRQAGTDKECLYTEQHKMLKWVLKQYGIYRWTTAESTD